MLDSLFIEVGYNIILQPLGAVQRETATYMYKPQTSQPDTRYFFKYFALLPHVTNRGAVEWKPH